MANLAEKIDAGVKVETRKIHNHFGGITGFYTHTSQVNGCDMDFAVFVPPQAEQGPVPVLFYLSGLTCTDENFTSKAGAQKYAAKHGIIIVAPDTSPRGCDLPGEDESYDFGTGAGFYVDATVEPWAEHYNMYSYITAELPEVIAANFPADMSRVGITGHSMGGHGALICALKNPGMYKSVSAFAPIVAPSQVPWGTKALTGYLGDDQESWKAWDATELVKTAQLDTTILVDQGSADDFLEKELKPELFEAACKEAGQPLELRMQEGYDHSYYFISTFIEDHIVHHAKALKA